MDLRRRERSSLKLPRFSDSAERHKPYIGPKQHIETSGASFRGSPALNDLVNPKDARQRALKVPRSFDNSSVL